MSNSTNFQSESKVFEGDWCAYYNAIQGCPPRASLFLSSPLPFLSLVPRPEHRSIVTALAVAIVARKL